MKTNFNFRKLYSAYLNCRKHKRKTYHSQKFEIHLESEILKLEKELKKRVYHPKKSICFIATKPIIREIFAATFQDRVVHHLLYNFLEPIFAPKFISQSYACQKNKGTHKSLDDLKKYLKSITQNGSKKTYFLHLDIKGFFTSIKKEILFKLIKKHISNEEILWLLKIIIFNNPCKNYFAKGDKSLFSKIPRYKSLFYAPENQGLPIGNLTSQFFANVYLNELDQFAKHKLKIKYYLRYADDILILDKTPQKLKDLVLKIEKFLKENLQLEINHKKTIIKSVYQGIDWVGYIVFPKYTLVRQRTVKNFKKKLFHFNQIILKKDPDLEELEKIRATINSYYGIFKHANTYNLRKNLYEKHFKELKKYFKPNNKNFEFFEIKKEILKKLKELEF